MLGQEKVGEVECMTTLLKLLSCHLGLCGLVFHFVGGDRRDESRLNLDTSLHVGLTKVFIVFIGRAQILREHLLDASFGVIS